MKKWILGVGAVCVFAALLLLSDWKTRSATPRVFSVGSSLPHGKVEPQLISTWDTAVLLAPDGSLWAWGGYMYGCTALLGKRQALETPQRIGSSNAWRQIAVGYGTAFAIQEDGSLWGWGLNFAGQLTRAHKTREVQPVQIGSDTNWLQVSAGAGHCLAVRRDGSIWAWGQNDRGQVGDRTRVQKSVLTQVGEEHDWKAVAAGAFNSYALKTNGTIWGWGLDQITSGSKDNLQPLLFDSQTNWTSISAGDYCVLGVQADGTLWLRGQNAAHTLPDYVRGPITNFVQVGTDTDWVQAYAGQSFFFARKKDGTWWGCGGNDRGQLGFNSNHRSVGSPQKLPWNFEPWALGAGFGNTLLLTQDGNLWTWGERLGSEKRGNQGNFRQLLNRLTSFIHGGRGAIAGPPPTIDKTPYLIWTLPAETRASLEKEKTP